MLYQTQLRGSQKYRNWPAAFGFATLGTIMGAVGYLVLIDNPLYRLFPSLTDIFELRYILQERDHLAMALNLADKQEVYWQFVTWLAGIAVGIPLLFILLLTFGAREIDPIRHISGRRHLKGWAAIKDLRAAASEKIAESDAGASLHVVKPDFFFVHPWRSFVLTYNANRRAFLRWLGLENLNFLRITPPRPRLLKWTLSAAQEVQSILLVGAQGGGKTQILRSFLAAYIRRRYKFVILDLVKADFSSDFPPINKVEPMILGPWDQRSIVWDIARDLRTLPDAMAWAGGFVSVSEKDPLWGQAARSIVVGCVMVLKGEKGNDWGWSELQQIVTAPLHEMKARGIETAWPGCAKTFSDLESKTTASIAQNFTAAMDPIYFLAAGFSLLEAQGNKKLAIRQWLLNDKSPERALILLGNSEFGDTGPAFFRSVVELMTVTISSLSLKESKNRRIVFVLDELPQAGKLNTIKKLLEIGRSKGIAVIEAFQTISQFRQIYEQHEDAIIDALFSIKIFPRVNGESDQAWVAGQVGKRIVDIRKENLGSNGKKSFSIDSAKEINVISATELEQLGPSRGMGIRALVIGASGNALEILFPNQFWKWQREGFVKTPGLDEKLGAVSETATANIEQSSPSSTLNPHAVAQFKSPETQQTDILEIQPIEKSMDEEIADQLANAMLPDFLEHALPGISIGAEVLDAMDAMEGVAQAGESILESIEFGGSPENPSIATSQPTKKKRAVRARSHEAQQ